MPTQRIKQFESWSFSRYSDWVKCPRYASLKHLEKLTEPKGAALDRGTAIHDICERYPLQGGPVPKELELFTHEFEVLHRNKKALDIEGQMTFNREWQPVAWNDWNNAWVRIKIDAALLVQDTLGIIDYKTGKLRAEKNAEYALQMDLYALGGFCKYEEVKYAVPQLWYLDEGVIWPPKPLVYERKEVPRLKKVWELRVAPMLRDKEFIPTPGHYCTWCHYRRANDGPCEF